SDFYGAKFCQKYVDVMNVSYGWEKYLAQYSIDTILLPPDAPLAGALKQSTRWEVAYDDQVSIIFRRREPHPGNAPELRSARPTGSNVLMDSGKARDPWIAGIEQRDPRITN